MVFAAPDLSLADGPRRFDLLHARENVE